MVDVPLFEVLAPDPDPVLVDCPVGPVVKTAMGPEGLATAIFDETEIYRYRLSRVWESSLGRVAFIMLNPSIATHEILDPTVTRCVRFARAWEINGARFGQLEVVNLFALRSPEPKVMYRHPDPVGLGNDEAIVAAARAADLVIVAWGVHSELADRGTAVRGLLSAAGIELHYLRLTKDGHPGHPLYLPKASVPIRWPLDEQAAA